MLIWPHLLLSFVLNVAWYIVYHLLTFISLCHCIWSKFFSFYFLFVAYNNKVLFIIHRVFWLWPGCGIAPMCLLQSGLQTADRDTLQSGTKPQNWKQQWLSKLLLGIAHITYTHAPLAKASHVSKQQQRVISHHVHIGCRSAVTLLPMSSFWGSSLKEQPLTETCRTPLLWTFDCFSQA